MDWNLSICSAKYQVLIRCHCCGEKWKFPPQSRWGCPSYFPLKGLGRVVSLNDDYSSMWNPLSFFRIPPEWNFSLTLRPSWYSPTHSGQCVIWENISRISPPPSKDKWKWKVGRLQEKNNMKQRFHKHFTKRGKGYCHTTGPNRFNRHSREWSEVLPHERGTGGYRTGLSPFSLKDNPSNLCSGVHLRASPRIYGALNVFSITSCCWETTTYPCPPGTVL